VLCHARVPRTSFVPPYPHTALLPAVRSLACTGTCGITPTALSCASGSSTSTWGGESSVHINIVSRRRSRLNGLGTARGVDIIHGASITWILVAGRPGWGAPTSTVCSWTTAGAAAALRRWSPTASQTWGCLRRSCATSGATGPRKWANLRVRMSGDGPSALIPTRRHRVRWVG
jgi:hypothetical protein